MTPTSEKPRHLRTTVAATLAGAVTMSLLLLSAPPAAAASSVTARGISLAPSASCRYGDVDIDYSATGAEKQHVEFRSGTVVLNSFTVAPYRADFTGVEHILSRATPPVPTAGSELTVYVTIGTDPPNAATTAEFILTYRCTPAGNDAGGHNVVLDSCYGAYGACQEGPPETEPPATEPPATEPTPTAVEAPESTPSPPAAPVVAAPQFTG